MDPLPLIQRDEEAPPERSCSQQEVTEEEARLQKVMDMMCRVDSFKNLLPSEIPLVAMAFTTRVFQDGEMIVQQGDLGNELFFVQDGACSVKVRRSADGPDAEVRFLRHGDHFGESAMIEESPRNASVYAYGSEVTLSFLTRHKFQELGLQGRLELIERQTELNGRGLRNVVGSFGTCKSMAKCSIAMGLYLGLSILIFSHFEHWSVTDCVYFAMITLLTIGYGDIAPAHAVSRLFVVFFVLTALVVVAVFIGDFLESLVTAEIKNEKVRKKLHLQQYRLGIFDDEGKAKSWRRKFCACLLAISALISVNMLVAKFVLDDANSFVDSLYFSIVTLTTIGYGDIVPHTPGAKWAMLLFCFFGVPMFGMLLAKIVDIAYGKARNDQINCVVGGLTTEKFENIVEFCDEMIKAGAYNSKPRESRRAEVTPFEFLCFILVKNETISVDDVKSIMDNFSELDVDMSGTLEQADLVEWQRRGAINPKNIRRSASRHISSGLSIASPSSGACASESPGDM